MISLFDDPKSGNNKLVLASLITVFGVILVRTAWLCDDAYITFRVADNFVNGYGLVWNVGERVQVFTHPFWMLLLTSLNLFTGEIYYTSIFLSMALSLAAVVIAGFRISATLGSAVLAVLVLSTSKAFVEYSTSGLENSLTFLLIAIFYWQFLSGPIDLRKFLILSSIAALVAFNRLDTLLLVLPALIYVYSKVPRLKGALIGLAGFAPLLLWMVFALVYYGFPLPNTYFAKLHSGISSFDLIVQGIKYFGNSLKYDPITLIALIAGLAVVFKSKDKGLYAGAMGVCLYLIYTIKIGGDFMGGRFYGAPLLCSIILLVSRPVNLPPKKYLILTGAIIVYGLIWPGTPVVSGKDFGIKRDKLSQGHGITNERAYYYQGTGLLLARENNGRPNFKWYRDSEELRSGRVKAKVLGSVGFTGFAAGPGIHVIDINALTDPLLARLPVYNTGDWITGHFRRMVPKGYRETIETSQNKIADSNLAAYFDKIQIITSGKLFDKNRWTEIYRFHTGVYNDLLKKYLAKAILEVAFDSIQTPRASGTMWEMRGNTVINKNGLRILFDKECHAGLFEVSVDNNDVYRFVFIRGEERLAEYVMDSLLISTGGLRLDTLEVPDTAAREGFDIIEIIPSGMDECFALGHIRIL